MPRKPKLQVVQPAPDRDAPPADLGEPGKRLWRALLDERDDARAELSVTEREMLRQCCIEEDSAAELHAAGNFKEELAARAYITRTLARLQPKAGGFPGRPPGYWRPGGR
jgi:hypothetical protein